MRCSIDVGDIVPYGMITSQSCVPALKRFMLSAGAGSEVSLGQCAWKLVPFARSSLVVLLCPRKLLSPWEPGGLSTEF